MCAKRTHISSLIIKLPTFIGNVKSFPILSEICFFYPWFYYSLFSVLCCSTSCRFWFSVIFSLFSADEREYAICIHSIVRSLSNLFLLRVLPVHMKIAEDTPTHFRVPLIFRSISFFYVSSHTLSCAVRTYKFPVFVVVSLLLQCFCIHWSWFHNFVSPCEFFSFFRSEVCSRGHKIFRCIFHQIFQWSLGTLFLVVQQNVARLTWLLNEFECARQQKHQQ